LSPSVPVSPTLRPGTLHLVASIVRGLALSVPHVYLIATSLQLLAHYTRSIAILPAVNSWTFKERESPARNRAGDLNDK
jgi:hypothetical protein